MRPSILFITTDQHNPRYLGAHDPGLRTPNLDRLADEGVRFDRSYSSCPTCTPARATWITGQYAYKHGAWQIGTALDERCLSLPGLLGRAGYRTAMVGKSHLQPCLADGDSLESLPARNDSSYFREWHGPWYGFDQCEINVGHTREPHSASMHYRVWLEDHGVDVREFFDDERGRDGDRWTLPESYSPPAWVAERSIAFLEEHRRLHPEDPFYLTMNFPEPHRPFRVCDPYHSMYASYDPPAPVRRDGEWETSACVHGLAVRGQLNDQGWHGEYRIPCIGTVPAGDGFTEAYSPRELANVRAYAGMISLVDAQIGRVLDYLDNAGLSENTLVMFTSDHGDYLGDHFLWSKGALHYEGCTRVPTIVRWPSRVPSGFVSDSLVSNVDIAPTFMAAAGLQPHPEMQGMSQLAALIDPGERLRKGVLIDFRAEDGLYANSWITQTHRLSVYTTPGGNEVELYDLERDPHEFTNLAAEPEHASTVRDLLAELIGYRTATQRNWQARRSFS